MIVTHAVTGAQATQRHGPIRHERKQPAFRPTAAQADKPRVREARQRRYAQIKNVFAAAGIDYPARHVLLRVFKREGVVELWVQPSRAKPYVHLKDYDICMRSGVLGPKRRQGDLQVPEGFYEITWFNPHSNFWLSMKVSYPNRSDRIRGGRNPGGDIFIHGSCVTIGCIPIRDRWIEELYLISLDSHWRYGRRPAVHIFPTRLDDSGMTWLEKTFSNRRDLLSFWKELRPGFLYFEEKHLPARFTIDEDGRYRFHQPLKQLGGR
ncbi:MAG: hypothetical protein D6806_14070 [Deltaproteobacteria bacterium]|nr:MAG: hypothetical protein D6806_14070 [Deltaproteobacteria bacterium]